MHILACRGALTAQGSVPTRGGARTDVAFRFHNNVGTLDWLISQLHTSPTSAPVNASPLALRPDTHDSGNSVVRYTFTIWDLHPLCIASSPGALWTRPRCQGEIIRATSWYRCSHVSGLLVQVTSVLQALMKSALPLLINLPAFQDLTNTRV
jgi:hypothetical protein